MKDDVIWEDLGEGEVEIKYLGKSDDTLCIGVHSLEEFCEIIIDKVILKHTDHSDFLIVHDIIDHLHIIELCAGSVLLIQVLHYHHPWVYGSFITELT